VGRVPNKLVCISGNNLIESVFSGKFIKIFSTEIKSCKIITKRYCVLKIMFYYFAYAKNLFFIIRNVQITMAKFYKYCILQTLGRTYINFVRVIFNLFV